MASTLLVMPAGGPTAIRGFNFQFAASAVQVLRLIQMPSNTTVTFEGPADSADFSTVFEGDRARRSFQFKSRITGNWTPNEMLKIIRKWEGTCETDSDELTIQLQGLPSPSLQKSLTPSGEPNVYVPREAFIGGEFEANRVRIEFGLPDVYILVNNVEAALHQLHSSPALYRDVHDQAIELLQMISHLSGLPEVEHRTVEIEKLALKIGVLRNTARGATDTLNFNGISQSRKELVNSIMRFIELPSHGTDFDQQSARTIILHGPSGIGKSHLRREISRCAGIQNLRVVEVEVPPNADTMGTLTCVVDSLGTPINRIVSSNDAIVALQLLLNNFDVLICDNVEDDGAVRALDSIAGTCKVVALRVSGRSIPKIDSIPIPEIEHGFLQTRVHASTSRGSQCVRNLDSWCNGFPILITAVITQIERLVNDGIDVDDACRLLDTDLAARSGIESQNLGSKFENIVKQLLSQLGTEDRDRLISLCCLQQPISIDAMLLEQIWQLDTARTLSTLGRLAQVGIIYVTSSGVSVLAAFLEAILKSIERDRSTSVHEQILFRCSNSVSGRQYLQKFACIHQFAAGDWWSSADTILLKLSQLDRESSIFNFLELARALDQILRTKVSVNDGSSLAWTLIWAMRSSMTADPMFSSVDTPLGAYVYGTLPLLASIEYLHPEVALTAISTLVSFQDRPLNDPEITPLLFKIMQTLNDPRLSPVSDIVFTSIRRLAKFQPNIQSTLGEFANSQLERLLSRPTPIFSLYFIAQLGPLMDQQYFNIQQFFGRLLEKYSIEELAEAWAFGDLRGDLTQRLVAMFAMVDVDRAYLFADHISHLEPLEESELHVAMGIGKVLSKGRFDGSLPDCSPIEDETFHDLVLSLALQRKFREAVHLLRERRRNRWWCATASFIFAEYARRGGAECIWEVGFGAALNTANQLPRLSGLEALADILEMLVRLDPTWARSVAIQCLSRVDQIDGDYSRKLRLTKRLKIIMLRAGENFDRSEIIQLLGESDAESTFSANWVSGQFLKERIGGALRILPPKIDESNAPDSEKFLRRTTLVPTFGFWSGLKRCYDSDGSLAVVRAAVSVPAFGDPLSRDSGFVSASIQALARGEEHELLGNIARRSFELRLEVEVALTFLGAGSGRTISATPKNFRGLHPLTQLQLASCLLNNEIEFGNRLLAKEYGRWILEDTRRNGSESRGHRNVLSTILAEKTARSMKLEPVLNLAQVNVDILDIAVSDFWGFLDVTSFSHAFEVTSAWIARNLESNAETWRVPPGVAQMLLTQRVPNEATTQLLSLRLRDSGLVFESNCFSLSPDLFFEIAERSLTRDDLDKELRRRLQEKLAVVLEILPAYNSQSLACLVLSSPHNLEARRKYVRNRVGEDDIELAETILSLVQDPVGPSLIDHFRVLFNDYARGALEYEPYSEYSDDELAPEELFKYLSLESFQLLLDSKILLDYVVHPQSIAIAFGELIKNASINASYHDVLKFLELAESARRLIR